jgi:hypothetical protein
MYVCILNDYDIFPCPTRHLRFIFVIDRRTARRLVVTLLEGGDLLRDLLDYAFFPPVDLR